MKKELKSIDFQGKNFKITGLETNVDEVFFSIMIGSKEMYMSGNYQFNCVFEDGHFEVDNCDVMIEPFQWEHNMKCGFLNQRNTILICEAIEKELMKDPEGNGFDYETYEDNQRNFYECLQSDIRKQLNREKCY